VIDCSLHLKSQRLIDLDSFHYINNLRNLGATNPVPPVPGSGVDPVNPVGRTNCIPPDGHNVTNVSNNLQCH
jgi:hypothetical protein